MKYLYKSKISGFTKEFRTLADVFHYLPNESLLCVKGTVHNWYWRTGKDIYENEVCKIIKL